jgi:hypothetical protein
MAKAIPNTVRLKVDFISVDRTQYKPYFSQLSSPHELFIEIPLDGSHVVESTLDGKMIVLTVDGLADIMVKVADGITSADDKARIKRFGH